MRNLENFRLVITGISSSPTKIWSEHTIEEDSFVEIPEKEKFKNIDFSNSLADVWKISINTIKTKENL